MMTELNLPHEFRPVTRAEAKIMGAKRYFTGKPCCRGHVCERHTSNCLCLMCSRENKEAWYAANPKKVKEGRANYRKNNKEKIAKADAAYHKNNKEKIAKIKATYRKKNKDKIAKQEAAWRASNPEKSRCIVRARRARKRNAEGRHTAVDVQRIFDAQRGKCAHCLTGIKAGYHVDHIQPISRGGSNWPRNLQLLCAPCNQRKHAADPIDFARREGKLV
jgi:5-methylcytosine-specific restriction endonuclease McrA